MLLLCNVISRSPRAEDAQRDGDAALGGTGRDEWRCSTVATPTPHARPLLRSSADLVSPGSTRLQVSLPTASLTSLLSARERFDHHHERWSHTTHGRVRAPRVCDAIMTIPLVRSTRPRLDHHHDRWSHTARPPFDNHDRPGPRTLVASLRVAPTAYLPALDATIGPRATTEVATLEIASSRAERPRRQGQRRRTHAARASSRRDEGRRRRIPAQRLLTARSPRGRPSHPHRAAVPCKKSPSPPRPSFVPRAPTPRARTR